MNFNNFTIKAQEAVQEAVNLVQSRGQQAIEPVRVLASVMKSGENVTNFIFQKLGMNGQQMGTCSWTSKLILCPRYSAKAVPLTVKRTKCSRRPPNIPRKWVMNSSPWNRYCWLC